MKFKDLAAKYISTLSTIYSDNESEAIYFMAIDHICHLKRVDYIIKKDTVIPTKQLDLLEVTLSQLITGKPIQYILGVTYFYNLPFNVNEEVLIPRPETEELVDWIIENEQDHTTRLNILDIGTGSGCIAIALKQNLKHADVFAIDIATSSIAIAQENAKLNKVDVKFFQQDILTDTKNDLAKKYQVIVSNPPYVRMLEKAAMHKNVLANEPHRALFVEDQNPLIFYNAIADFARINLDENGSLYFEINEYLGKETVDLLVDKGFTNILLRKDMQGKDRMIYCRK